MLFSLVLLFAPALQANSIQLSNEVEVAGLDVLLRDVARLEGRDAESFADLAVATFGTSRKRLTVTAASLRQTLSKHGAHWGRLTLRGFSACKVERVESTHEPIAVESQTVAPAVANPLRPVDTSTPTTLRDRVVRWIEQNTGVNRDELRIEFSSRDAATLARPALDDRYEFESLSRGVLGRKPIIARQLRAGRVVSTHRITADVTRRVTAVVATTTIGRHQTIHEGDVALQQIYTARSGAEPAIRIEDVTGRIALSVLRPGTVIYQKLIRSQRMIRRGDMVDVNCFVGGLVIETVARAMKDGSVGDLIPVRNEHPKSRRTYLVRVSGSRRATLELKDGSAAGPVPSEEGAPARTLGVFH